MARIYQRRAKFAYFYVGPKYDAKSLNVEVRSPDDGLSLALTAPEALRIAGELVAVASKFERQRAVDEVAAMVDALTRDEAGDDD